MQILTYIGMLAVAGLAGIVVYAALVEPHWGPARVEHRPNPFSHAQMLAACIDTHRLISNADYVRATIISADILLTQPAARRPGVSPAQVLDAVDDYASHMMKPQAVLNCLPDYAGTLAAQYPIGYRALNDALVRVAIKQWRDAHAFKAKA